MGFCQQQINHHIHNVKIWRRSIENTDLINFCQRHFVPHIMHSHKDAHCGKCEQNQSYLLSFKRLSVSSDAQNEPQTHLKISSKFLTLM